MIRRETTKAIHNSSRRQEEQESRILGTSRGRQDKELEYLEIIKIGW